MAANWVTALFGLIGTVLGAATTLTGQFIVARRQRRAQMEDAERDRRRDVTASLQTAVAELLAAKDVLIGEYEALWQQLGADRGAAADISGRTIEAWAAYQRARPGVRLIAPPEVDRPGSELREGVYELVNAVDAARRGWTRSPDSLDPFLARIAGADKDLIVAVRRYTSSVVEMRRGADGTNTAATSEVKDGDQSGGPSSLGR